MKILNGESYLITTDSWFFAPDGHQYKAVWGQVYVYPAEEVLGLQPSRSTNWFIRVGQGEKSIVIAGCQLHYAVKLTRKPHIEHGTYEDEPTKQQAPLNRIYIP